MLYQTIVTRAGKPLPLIVVFPVLAFTGTTFSTRMLNKMSAANFRNWTQRTVLTMVVIYFGSGVWMLAGFKV